MLYVGLRCVFMYVPCSLAVTCWERADLLAVMFAVFCHFPKCVLFHIRIKGEVGALKLVSASSKIFYRPFQGGTSFVDHLCFSDLCLLCLCASLLICALWSPAGKGLISWPSFVLSNCEFVTFPLVSWVRCGTRLYRILIFALLL